MKNQKVYINGQTIRYSFVQKLFNKYGKYETAKIFFRARNSKSIIGWITRGLTKDKNSGVQYALRSVKEEFDNSKEVEEWINKYFFNAYSAKKLKSNKKPEQLNDILSNILL